MAVSEFDFQFVSVLLKKRLGIQLEKDKAYLVESRLSRVAEKSGMGSLAQLFTQLKSLRPPEALVNEVLEAMTTNETYFFRDSSSFDALRDKVFPELLGKNKNQKSLNVWSAACSTGQEPYSIAITLRECLPQQGDWNIRILGTDVATQVLQRARDGVYNGAETARGLTPGQLSRYLVPEGETWKIRDEIRKMVSFQPLNLNSDWPYLAKMDVIFLRNVLIYMDDANRKAIFSRIHQLLNKDGYLFLGAAETTYSISDLFRRVEWEKAGCFRPL